MQATTQLPTPVLDAGAVYLGDNGRAFCGACAGSSARFTGHDISGLRLHRVSANEAADALRQYGVQIACEHCGKQP